MMAPVQPAAPRAPPVRRGLPDGHAGARVTGHVGATMDLFRIGLCVVLLCVPEVSAQAHDVWRTGEVVPDWVKHQCCGVSDAHRLEPGQVRRVEGGYRVDGYPDLIPASLLLPSQDGDWWVFYRMHPDRSYSRVFCFFGPLNF